MIMTVSGASLASPASWTSVRDLPVGFIVLPRSAGAPIYPTQPITLYLAKKCENCPGSVLSACLFHCTYLRRSPPRPTKHSLHLAPSSHSVIVGIASHIAPAD